MITFEEAQAVRHRIEVTRAVGWWIDRQIEKGLTDEQIVERLPLATLFIAGEITLPALGAQIRVAPPKKLPHEGGRVPQ